jgi:hypothetical protein
MSILAVFFAFQVQNPPSTSARPKAKLERDAEAVAGRAAAD